MDLRCHGDSPLVIKENTMENIAADVIATLEKNNLSVSTVVGHSFGGKVVLEMMKHPPTSVKTAIVLDISLIF